MARIANRQSLEAALPLIAKAIGGQYGINVVVGGNQAHTDHKTIFIPALPSTMHEADAIAYLHGYLDHEAMHIRYTDPGLTTFDSDFHHEVWNRIEDVWGEGKMGRKYPGCKSNLERLVRKMVDNQEFKAATADLHPGDIVARYISHSLRSQLLGQSAINDLASQSESVLRSEFPKGMVVRLNGLLSLVTKSLSSSDNLAIASSILAMLEEEKDKDDEDTDPGDSGDQGSDDSKGDPSNDPGYQGNDDSKGDASDDSGQPDKNQTSDKPGSSGGSGQGNPGRDDKARREAIQQALSSTKNDLGEKAIGDILQDKMDDITKGQSGSGAGNGTPVTIAEFQKTSGRSSDPLAIQRVRRSSNALSTRLERLIETLCEEDSYEAPTGAELSSCLYKARLNNPNIMMNHDENEMPLTALHILVDRSGSMRTDSVDRLSVALDSALAIACSLESVQGVDLAVSAFPGSSNNHIIPLKRMDERVRLVAGRFNIGDTGTTPTANAMWAAISNLLMSEKPRKILVVITDGEPDGAQRDGVRDLVARCKHSGVEVLGLGINTSMIKDYFPVSENIVDLNALAPALFKMLQRSFSIAA